MKAEEYFDGQLGLDIWEKKYQNDGESFDDWVARVSGHDTVVMGLIYDKKFMFAGRILAARGVKDRKLSYSNCYGFPLEDSLESIYQIAGDIARTYSYGGGCGVSLNNLSPEGTEINNAAKQTSGAVSFGELFNTTTELIGQDGRRGALMLSMSCDHFEIEKFIDAKAEKGALQKANLSVEMRDVFMKAAERGEFYEQVFSRKGKTYRNVVNAGDVFRKLVKNNHDWSEPGILYKDRIDTWHAMSDYDVYEYVAVNPCSEKNMIPYGACLLGSINLSEFVTKNGTFNYEAFEYTIYRAVRALNQVLDEGIDKHPLKKQRETAEAWRQIGLGVMGYADMLIKMGKVYGSESAIFETQFIAKFMCDKAFKASALLAAVHGPFPNFDLESTLASKFIQENCSEETIELIKKYGLRNSEILSIAPTGSISTMLNISGGIEPLFALEYNRRTESLHGEDVSYVMRPKIVQRFVDVSGGTDYPECFITSGEIEPINRIKTQATWQDYIDSSISSTINLPNEATEDDVYNIYMEAWKYGLKGITVHRSGSKREGVLTIGDEPEEAEEDLKRGDWSELSDDIIYHKRKIHTGCGKITIFIGHSPRSDKVEELYLKRSGKGGCERSLDALIIAMSGMLRLGGSLDNIEKALHGIGPCSSFVNARSKGIKLSNGSNCAFAIMNELKKFKKDEIIVIETGKSKCPECKEPVIFESGCITCKNCGYSKCD